MVRPETDASGLFLTDSDAVLPGGGGKGIRTPDLLIANETLYQLSYTPVPGKLLREHSGLAHGFKREFTFQTVNLRDCIMAWLGSGRPDGRTAIEATGCPPRLRR